MPPTSWGKIATAFAMGLEKITTKLQCQSYTGRQCYKSSRSLEWLVALNGWRHQACRVTGVGECLIQHLHEAVVDHPADGIKIAYSGQPIKT